MKTERVEEFSCSLTSGSILGGQVTEEYWNVWISFLGRVIYLFKDLL